MNRGVISSFLSFIYSSLVAIRNFFYETKILSTKSLNCKVISIGNITVGGSGKTPTVEYLSNLLQSKGHNVGIISRGYKRKSKSTLVVTDGKKKPKSWEHVGDEPYLLAHKLENIPIVVGVSRYKSWFNDDKKISTQCNSYK
jgi:tetraacyldisaccharide 4''-kinase